MKGLIPQQVRMLFIVLLCCLGFGCGYPRERGLSEVDWDKTPQASRLRALCEDMKDTPTLCDISLGGHYRYKSDGETYTIMKYEEGHHGDDVTIRYIDTGSATLP